MEQIPKSITSGRKGKYLVFTSAGDNNNVSEWLIGPREFDIWACYYGDTVFNCAEHVEFHVSKKGGKFPNLQYIYQHYQKQLEKYEAVFVLDDDIIISATDINRLFEIREQHDLWLLQPAFNPRGKISHPITERIPFCFMRYTNFIENGCALFRKDKLDDFMDVFDSTLVGYGTDYWFIDSLGPDIVGKVAIIDEVTCINPYDHTKDGGKREIELLQENAMRARNWEIIKEKHNIQVQSHIEFSLIPSLLKANVVSKGVMIWLIKFNHKSIRLIRFYRQWLIRNYYKYGGAVKRLIYYRS